MRFLKSSAICLLLGLTVNVTAQEEETPAEFNGRGSVDIIGVDNNTTFRSNEYGCNRDFYGKYNSRLVYVRNRSALRCDITEYHQIKDNQDGEYDEFGRIIKTGSFSVVDYNNPNSETPTVPGRFECPVGVKYVKVGFYRYWFEEQNEANSWSHYPDEEKDHVDCKLN